MIDDSIVVDSWTMQADEPTCCSLTVPVALDTCPLPSLVDGCVITASVSSSGLLSVVVVSASTRCSSPLVCKETDCVAGGDSSLELTADVS